MAAVFGCGKKFNLLRGFIEIPEIVSLKSEKKNE